MEIEIIPKKEQEERKIPFKAIPAGTVYEAIAGILLLKLENGEAVLLNYGINTRDFGDRLVLAKGFKNYPAIKILGRLKKITVEEI